MAAEIKYNGSVIASPEAGQTATLKCGGMVMESDVVVEVAEVSGGGSGTTVVPLIVTENGTYNTYYETDTATWDANTVPDFTIPDLGAYKKAENLIVPNDLSALSKWCSFVYGATVDGEVVTVTAELDIAIEEDAGFAFGQVSAVDVLWVKSATALNETLGVSYFEDNSVYLGNAMYLNLADLTDAFITLTAPSSDLTDVAFSPVTVNVQPNLQSKYANITQQETTITPDDGADGMSEVTVRVELQEKTTTATGTVIPDDGYAGLSQVNVNLPLQEKKITLTGNGTVEVTPDSSYAGMSKTTITVDTGENALLQGKEFTITENGTHDLVADDGYDGLSLARVTIAVENVIETYDGTISVV